MNKFMKIFRKIILPIVMIGMVFYIVVNVNSIKLAYSIILNGKSEALSADQQSVLAFRTVENQFKDWASEDIFNRKKMLDTIENQPGWSKLSERNMKLIQGTWAEDKSSDEAVELVFKVSNLSVGLFNVDSTKAYIEHMSANSEDNTITLLVRLKEVL